MNEEGQLLWTAVPQKFGTRHVVSFSYSPVLGLSDIDFHQITAKDWRVMKSPAADAVARLVVPPELSISALHDAIALLHTKGGYATVQVLIK